MAINRNAEIKRLHTFSDKAAEIITYIAGSMPFLLLNVGFFTFWILLNTGAFGYRDIIDHYPFSFLTTAVSLEAIVLSSFVLMSQRRQARLSELRTEMDYRTDVQAEVDIKSIVYILERIAQKQGVDVSDLMRNMKSNEHRAEKAIHEPTDASERPEHF